MPRHAPTVSTDIVRLLLKYAATQQINLAAVFETLTFKRDAITAAGQRVSAEQFKALWTAIRTASGDPDFGLHFGTAQRTPPAGTILFSVLMNCRSLGDALEKLARYHGLVTDVVRLHLHREGDHARYTLANRVPARPLERHYVETMLSGQILTIRHLTENQAQVIEARFSHARPVQTHEQERIFQCPLRFDQPENELVLHMEDLDLPIFLANPALLDGLERLAQEMLTKLDANAVWTERVGQLIGQRLLSGKKPTLDAVAQELALSPRHLQNKLRAENTTYRQLLEQLRQDTALRYLQDSTATICDIAFLLGFSDQSAFTNAFKRWTGHNPSYYRGS